MTKPLDYSSIRNPRTNATLVRKWVAGAIVGVAIAGVWLLARWYFVGNIERPARPYCMSNMRQIALACIVYSGQNSGRFPTSLATLYPNSELVPEAFICPATDHRAASGPTAQAIGAALAASPPPNAPGCCCSYIYVGADLTYQSPPTAVALYEPASNHGGDGGNVVYADASVKWHDAKSLAKIVAALNAGQNPPP